MLFSFSKTMIIQNLGGNKIVSEILYNNFSLKLSHYIVELIKFFGDKTGAKNQV